MSKTEELKQKAYREISNYVGGFWVEYHFNETELDEYAQQVSWEAAELLKIARCPNIGCDNNGTLIVTRGLDGETYPESEECEWCFNRDLWLKEQEEQ